MQVLPGAITNKAVTTYEDKGTHLLLTLRGCSPAVINDTDKMRDLARAAALATGATVLDTFAYKFEPQGMTVLVVLAESHASLHTYPESNTIFWDCFTCGSTCRPELSEAVLVEALKPAVINRQVIVRE